VGVGATVCTGLLTSLIVGQMPAQIQTTLGAQGSVTTTWLESVSIRPSNGAPEEATLALFAAGLAALAFRRRKR